MRPINFIIRAYTQKELASFYGSTPKTFRFMLRKSKVDLGPRLGNVYTPLQVRKIVEHLGEPEGLFAEAERRLPVPTKSEITRRDPLWGDANQI